MPDATGANIEGWKTTLLSALPDPLPLIGDEARDAV